MRITGHGSGQGASGSAYRDSGQSFRAEEFRRDHHVGERLSGRLLAWEGARTAWVDISGRSLLARIDTLPPPEPGQILHFEVTALHPEVILKELSQAQAVVLDPAALYRQFVAERSRFEVLASPLLHALAGEIAAESRADRQERRRRFLLRLARQPESLASYLRLLGLKSGISALLGLAQGGAAYHYLPWLLPEAREQELLVEGGDPANPFWSMVYGFTLDTIGRGEIRLFHRQPRTGYRLMLEHPEHGPRFLALLQGHDFSFLPLNLDFLGVSQLPSSSLPGILAGRIAAPSRPTARPGLNVRV